jgi:hypothetical protein
MVSGIVADGLLAFRWEVEQSGGDEVGGFEDLEVALCSVVAFGAVDDGLAGGVPGDFLEGKGMAALVRRRRRLRKMPRRTRGMVKTNWRWGTSWQTEVAIHSLVERTRRWWQEGQKWRAL